MKIIFNYSYLENVAVVEYCIVLDTDKNRTFGV